MLWWVSWHCYRVRCWVWGRYGGARARRGGGGLGGRSLGYGRSTYVEMVVMGGVEVQEEGWGWRLWVHAGY